MKFVISLKVLGLFIVVRLLCRKCGGVSGSNRTILLTLTYVAIGVAI